jgi:radical SAM superfamily enzyme YgiQ (UPF0313 family)
MMNFLLVNTNTIKPPLIPIGIVYLAGFLKAAGYPPHVIDLNPLDDPLDFEHLLADIPEPDLIGFSIRNIDSTQMNLPEYFLPDIIKIIDTFKSRFPNTPTVLGGAGYSVEPIEIIERIGADFGVSGEGETPTLDLIKCIESGGDYKSIPGLIYKTDFGYKINPPRLQDNEFLARLPFQDIEVIDYQRYFDIGGMASVQTKRGCALNCNYCTYPLVEGKRFRLVPAARVVDELEYLISKGFDYFHFTDSICNVPRKHLIDVCQEIIKRKLKLKWHSYTSPFRFDEEVAQYALESGCDAILLGADSISDPMLAELGKNFSKEDVFKAAEACRNVDLEVGIWILFGSPGENIDTINETLDALDEIQPTAAFLTQGIRVYRNTPIQRKLIKLGKLSPDQSLLDPYFYYSEDIPDDINDHIRSYAIARDWCYSDVTIKSPSTDEKVAELYRKGVKGPCWRLLKALEALSAGS